MYKYFMIIAIILVNLVPLVALWAQNDITLHDNFEGVSNIGTWYGDKCAIDTAFTNPQKKDINNSSSVLCYHDTGGKYANIGFDLEETFNLSAGGVFTLKVYIPSSGLTGEQPNQIAFKLQNGNMSAPWGTQCQIIKPLVLDAWQEVSFDFNKDEYINFNQDLSPPDKRTDFNRVVIQLNGENNTDHVLAFIDDFSYDGYLTPKQEEDFSSTFDYLVWSDEFNEGATVDTSKWFFQTKIPNGDSWYNNEVQHYTNRIENTFIQDSSLYIKVKRETFTDQGQTKEFTSGRLNSKYAFKYGRIEARAKLPTGLGTWPAIWMLGKNVKEEGSYWAEEYGTVEWPACGEIDIMEHWGDRQNYISAATHTPSSHGVTVNTSGIIKEGVSDEFHIYGVDWTPERLVFTLDGKPYYTYKPYQYNERTYPFDHEMYLILNVAMAGNIAPEFGESSMEVDYIRVYQHAPNNENWASQTYIRPNLTDSAFTAYLPSAMLGAKVSIYNTEGKELATYTQEKIMHTYNMTTYAKGEYMIKFALDDEVFTKKVLKR